MSAQSELFTVAEMVLESGKDRIPRLPDKRRLPSLRRLGLIEYLDGYSVSARAMEKAVEWWEMVARDAAKGGRDDRAQELNDLAERGRRWADRHQKTPDLKKLRFGDLNFDQYHALWELVTKGDRLTAHSLLTKPVARGLLRKRYLEETVPGADTLLVTDGARQLVRDYGNPFLSQRTAAERVATQYLTASDITVHNVEFSADQEPSHPYEFASLLLVDFTVRGRTLAKLLGKQMRVLERFLETAPKRKLLNAIWYNRDVLRAVTPYIKREVWEYIRDEFDEEPPRVKVDWADESDYSYKAKADPRALAVRVEMEFDAIDA